MKIKPLSQLPSIETEPFSDWSFVSRQYVDEQSLYLVYATQRDFLSVPKTYTVAEFVGTENRPLAYYHIHREDYLSELDWVEPEGITGLFEVEADDGSQIVLLLDESSALEIVYEKRISHPSIYHCSDAMAALSQFLIHQQSDSLTQ